VAGAGVYLGIQFAKWTEDAEQWLRGKVRKKA